MDYSPATTGGYIDGAPELGLTAAAGRTLMAVPVVAESECTGARRIEILKPAMKSYQLLTQVTGFNPA